MGRAHESNAAEAAGFLFAGKGHWFCLHNAGVIHGLILGKGREGLALRFKENTDTFLVVNSPDRFREERGYGDDFDFVRKFDRLGFDGVGYIEFLDGALFEAFHCPF